MEWPTNPPCSREDLRYCMGPGCAQLEPQRSLSRPLCPRSIRRATPSAQQRTLQPPRSCQLIVSSFFLFFFCFITLGFYQLSRAPHVAGRKLTATFRSPFAFCYHPVPCTYEWYKFQATCTQEEDGGGGLDEAQIQKKRDENVKWAKVQDSNISFSDRT